MFIPHLQKKRRRDGLVINAVRANNENIGEMMSLYLLLELRFVCFIIL